MERDLRDLSPATRWIARRIEVFDAVDSTNLIGERLLREGAPDGTLVIADSQTAGRGRLGRSFFSPAGRSLYMSVLLRPEMPADRLHRHVFAAAVAVADCAAAILPPRVTVEIKWPNDVLLDGRKTSGINLPAQMDGERISGAVLGIGINVNNRPQEFPHELRETATSLYAAGGAELDRISVAESLLRQLEHWLDQLRAERFEDVLRAWRARFRWTGRRVRVGGPGVARPFEGRVIGIDAEGALLLETAAGAQRVLAGDVSLAPDTPPEGP